MSLLCDSQGAASSCYLHPPLQAVPDRSEVQLQAEGQLARWLQKLQEYQFEVVHRRGRNHQNADSLFRLPCTQCGRDTHHAEDVQLQVSEQDLQCDIKQEQLEDPAFCFVLKAIENGNKPSTSELSGRSREEKKLVQIRNQLELRNGALCRRYEDEDGRQSYLQVILPQSLR